jgi:hypothetical protein
MIVSIPYDGWGNRILQYCVARALGAELDYFVQCKKIRDVVNSGDWNLEGKRVEWPVFNINPKENYKHRMDFEEIKDLGPRKFVIRSYLEHYPHIEKHRNEIINDWVYIHQPFDRDSFDTMKFSKQKDNEFIPHQVDNITSDDLVLSVRLGRDYLGQHRKRLLIGDYFKIVLDNVKYDRLFITSQDPLNPVLEDLYEYDPIFVHHITPIHTLNFVRLFNKIVLSQSTFSWWAAYLSEAEEIYFPITKDGPWSYGPNQRSKWKDVGHDLMVNEPRYVYVSYPERRILGNYSQSRSHLEI